MSDAELEAFKTQIDLRQYAASIGYTLDRKESWRGSAVMRNAGDKIVIKRGTDGHYVYFSVRDDTDNGTLIDFIQHRERLSLGAVRKKLRPWLGKFAPSLPLFPDLDQTSKNRFQVEQEYSRMQDALRHVYLETERALPAGLIASPRFAGRVKTDRHANAVFPHFDEIGLCGYELKNSGFTGFAKGGEKGLWFSHAKKIDTRLVFAESAIDALSYAVLFPDEHTRYASVGGNLNPKQPDLIQAAILKMPQSSEIVAAMDADETGRNLAGVIHQAVLKTPGNNLRCVLAEPVRGKDWNDQLRAVASSFPTAQII